MARTALPFDLHVAPEEAFEHAGRRQARRTVLEALAAGWPAAIIGDAGAGRTLLLQDLERVLRAGGLCARFGRPDQAMAEPGSRGTVWLVDDADALDDAALEQLIRTGGATVLVMGPDTAQRIRRLSTRVAFARLPPLSAPEVEEFVASALAGAHASPDLFSAAAITRLAALSGGLPQQLSRLGRASLLCAQREQSSRVEARHVEAAAEILLHDAAPGIPETEARAAPLLLNCATSARAVAHRWHRGLMEHRRAAMRVVPVVSMALLAGWVVAAGRLPWQERDVPVANGAPVLDVPAAERAPVITAGGVSPSPHHPAAEGGNSLQDIAPVAVAARPEGEELRFGGAESPPLLGVFRGTTFNETLGRGGQLRITVSRAGSDDAVVVQFEANGGLVGAGRLNGRLGRDGRLVASGTLMMGRNPFATELAGTIEGHRLSGTARYTRVTDSGLRSSSTQGSFRLTRG